ncbi:uncharacterized protein LOC100902192 [Galendromus occidentalis]|uniref:Uncharacterized protein LOC100902192 n=1 Tax=Galendromus occidentalis TaxID=34638 RepID=A0AAJ6QN54_9ACAR|nr:uncharacterized protein LOC100902192 [Galendromus occidentalis]
MGQSIPFVQGMKKHLELAYDNLGQIETMMDCFTDANSLRKFLVGEESFMFEPVQNEIRDPPRSPVVKQAPPREHHRFDDEGDIETIMEQNSEDAENITMNCSPRAGSTFTRPTSPSLGTSTVTQRRSSRRSSIGIPRPVPERAQNRLTSEIPVNQQPTNSSKSSEEDSFERRSELRQRRSSNLFPRSSTKRTTYVKMPEPPQIIVSEASSCRMSSTMEVETSQNGNPDNNENTDGFTLTVCDEAGEPPLTWCEMTRDETERLPQAELAQNAERSPTAVNVAQIWANADNLRPQGRIAPSADVYETFRGTESALADTGSADNTELDPLMTTRFPSPVLCEKNSDLPTSTPALNKIQRQVTPPGVSIIVAETPTMSTPDTEPTVVNRIDCRRRKPILANGRASSSQFSAAMRRSVRFSTAPDDSETLDALAIPKPPVVKAAVSSPLVKRVRPKNTMNRQARIVGAERNVEEETPDEKPKTADQTDEPATASPQPVPRKTYVKKKAPARPVGRKRSQRQPAKADSTAESESDDAASKATFTVEGLGEYKLFLCVILSLLSQCIPISHAHDEINRREPESVILVGTISRVGTRSGIRIPSESLPDRGKGGAPIHIVTHYPPLQSRAAETKAKSSDYRSVERCLESQYPAPELFEG